MDSAHWNRVKATLDELLDVPSAERAAALERLAGGDRVLRIDVERLLQQDSTDALDAFEGVRDAALRHLGLGPPERLEPGATLGAYRVERLLGAGGMGEVYEATQENPRRSVALKVLGGRFRGEEGLSRFRYEAEVLGRLRHPGIAQVFEAGNVDGVPFIAMELVEDARTVLDWAREEQLTVPQIVAAVERICEAVAYGHRQGVIHRDLKPSNLLVDRGGAVKVIDFGIARSHGPDAVERTSRTRPGEVVGTLSYLSPEGWEGRVESVDIRSDVYSLGVVLQELLCGRRPFELVGLPFLQAAKLVAEGAPVRLRAVRPDLAPDLDWIVQRALERDPERRYPSAAELAADLGRFRRHEAVVAGPPTTRYRLARFVRRHRLSVTAAAIVAASLVVGVIGLATGLERARAAEQLANRRLESEQRERATAEAVTAFLLDMPRLVDADRLGENVPLLEVLRASTFDLETRFAEQPAVEAELRAVLGASLEPLGEVALAEEQLARALELERASASPDWARRVTLLRQLGELRAEAEDFAAADECFGEAEELLEQHVADSARASLELRLARVRASQANIGERVRELEALRAESLAELGPADDLSRRCGELLVDLYTSDSQPARSLELVEELLAELRPRVPEGHPAVLHLELQHAFALEYGGDIHGALAELLMLPERYAATFGADSFSELGLAVHIARLQSFVGRSVEAAERLEHALEVYGRRYGEGGKLGLGMLLQLAEIQLAQQRFADGDATAARVLELAPVGSYARWRILAQGIRAKALFALGDSVRAEELARAGLEEFEDSPRVPPVIGLELRKALAMPLIGLARYDEAEECVAEALALARDSLAPGAQDFVFFAMLQGRIELETGRYEEARDTLEGCYAEVQEFYPENPEMWLGPVLFLRRTYDALQRPELRAELDAEYEAKSQRARAGVDAPGAGSGPR